MANAGLWDLWNLLVAIIARQAPFAQIMIVVGSAFFLVMAIEGTRTSLLAMRRGSDAAPPELPPKPNSQTLAATATEAPRMQIHAPKQMPRPPARLLRKPPSVAAVKRLTPAIRRSDKINGSAYTSKTTSL